MKPVSEIDALRQRAILSLLAGFPFLLVFAVVWMAAGALSYVVSRDIGPWIYVLLGMPAMPITVTLERRLGYVRAAEPDPLLPLTLQILFVQVVAFPAILLVRDAAPQYVPVALAAVVGAHPWFQVSKLEARSHFPMYEVLDEMAMAIETFSA